VAIYLSFGFDDERPFGQLAKTDKGAEFRKKKMAFLKRFMDTFDTEEIPRTLFILGDYLNNCQLDVAPGELEDIYLRPLNDIAQHSYSHGMIKRIEGYATDRPIMTPADFLADVKKANDVLQAILDVKPSGLRIPLGYDNDLSDIPEIVQELKELGFSYVSSDLRASDSFNAPLTASRQPHCYTNIGCPGVAELPSHGWQDVVFTQEKSQALLGRTPPAPKEIIEHFVGLFDRARQLELPDVYISLCLHPWAVMDYDPNLEILLTVARTAREQQIEIITYSDVAKKIIS